MNKRIILGSVVLVLLLVFAGRYCRNRDLKTAVKTLEIALESGNIHTIMGLVSKNYSDRYGNDYQALANIGEHFFETVGNLNFVVVRLQIDRSESRARVMVDFKIVGDFRGYRTYLSGGISDVSKGVIHFEKRKDRWLIIELENTELGDRRPAR